MYWNSSLRKSNVVAPFIARYLSRSQLVRYILITRCDFPTITNVTYLTVLGAYVVCIRDEYVMLYLILSEF
jgi:hypothetical protein